jgi:hypothetical protein
MFDGTLLAQNITFDPGTDDGAIAGFTGITGEHTTPAGFTAFMSIEGRIEREDKRRLRSSRIDGGRAFADRLDARVLIKYAPAKS